MAVRLDLIKINKLCCSLNYFHIQLLISSLVFLAPTVIMTSFLVHGDVLKVLDREARRTKSLSHSKKLFQTKG